MTLRKHFLAAEFQQVKTRVKQWITNTPTESQMKKLPEQARKKATELQQILNLCMLFAQYKCKEFAPARNLALKLNSEQEKLSEKGKAASTVIEAETDMRKFPVKYMMALIYFEDKRNIIDGL